MEKVREAVDRLLSQWEARDDQFDEYELHSAIIAAIRAVNPDFPLEAPDILAEAIAFEFSDRTTNNNPWGTYYGPMMSGTTAAGEEAHVPSLATVSPAVLAHWSARSADAKHAVMRARYADLVWDLSKAACGESPGVEVALRAVDAHLEVAARDDRIWAAADRLARALSIGISIRDDARVALVRDAMLKLDEASHEATSRNFGFAFDHLVENRKAGLEVEQVARVIELLEARLEAFATAEPVDPHRVEAAAMRLARYYQRMGDRDALRRVLTVYRDAFASAADRAAPLAAAAWLQQVFEKLCELGFRDLAADVEPQLRESGTRSREAMQTVSAPVEIPREEFDRFIDDVTTGTPSEAFRLIAINFLPRREQVEQQLRNVSESAPISFLIPRIISDDDGRAVARVGSLDEDLEGHIVLGISEDIGFNVPFLRAAFDRLASTGRLSARTIADFLYESLAFAEDKREVLEVGVTAYTRGDPVAALHVLIPQVEAALRRVLTLAGGSVYRPGRRGGLLLRPLEHILYDERTKQIFGDDITTYLRVLLVDQRGWNLRNSVSHGFVPSARFNSASSDRVMHALLVLGLVRQPEGTPK